MTPQKNWLKAIPYLMGILVMVNIFILDYQYFVISKRKTAENKTPVESSDLKTKITESDFLNPGITEDNNSEASLQALIKEATASLTQKVEILTQNSPKTPPSYSQTQPQTVNVKEYYIPLGSGSTNSSTWVEIPGVEAYVAPDNYGSIVSMYFEASIRIPTLSGSVYARLKNVTNQTSLFESEVFRGDSSGGLVSSGKLPVPVVTKLYRVEMKSTLGAQAVLDNARIKIFVK